MRIRPKFWNLLGILVAVEFAIFIVAIGSIYALMEDPAMRTRLVLFVGGSVFIFTALLTLAWTFIDLALLRALSAIEKGSSIIAHTNPAHELELPQHHLLGNLPLTIRTLAKKLEQAKNEVGQALQAGAMREQEQKMRLETVLKELSEGVIVCDGQSRLLLYNNAALRILGDNQTLGLGRSVYNLLTRAPVEHALQLLRGRMTEPDRNNFIEFICTTQGTAILLRSRLGLLAPRAPEETSSDSGFVLTFQDATAEIDTVHRRDNLLRGALDNLRRPFANLRAAAENLTAYPNMDIEDRRSFEAIIAEECKVLSDHLNTLSSDSRSLIGAEWAMADIYSVDLGMSIQRRLKQAGDPILTMTGIPLWLRIDSHALAVLFEHLIRQIQSYNQAKELDFEPLLGDRRIYMDLVWLGEPIPLATVESWLNEVLHEAVGSPTIREVVQQHDGDIWSQPHRRTGYSLLRIPLPSSPMQWETRRSVPPPPPEFYDFELPRRLSHTGPLMQRPLSELDYVVFDTETTGLRPSDGDEIVSIAGVRIVNRRVLSGETFMRLVNPKRPIPKVATHIHGITNTQVQDSPPIQVVLPQFKAFVGDAVLIAHNAAFDMRFIQLKETETGIEFDNPVLDVLLLSVFIHDHSTDHTLDTIAARLGVELSDRHSALGDALVTAQIFLGLVDLLEEAGIHTLGQALKTSEKLVEVRKQQEVF